MMIRGAAGVGKTTLLKEAVSGLEQSGHKVCAFAPSADASRGTLRSEGFASANTLARRLSLKQPVDYAGRNGFAARRSLPLGVERD